MRIHRYWERASAAVRWPSGPGTITRFGYSDDGAAAAGADAEARVRAATAAIEGGETPSPYGYTDRPLREEIVEEIERGGARIAAITRNAYGALILNAASALFADVDLPKSPGGGLVRRLFGGASDPGQAALDRIRGVLDGRLDARVYRTAAGFRCLITTRAFEPGSDESESLMRSLRTDALYVRMCSAQACFRARLTAKPWRCGIAPPPAPGFPWPDEASELAARAWEDAYHAKADACAACRLVECIGSSHAHPDVEPIVALHDDLACADGRPLA